MRPTFLLITLFTILLCLVAGVAQGQKDHTPQSSTQSGPVTPSGGGDHSAGGRGSQSSGANGKSSLSSQTGEYPTPKPLGNPSEKPTEHPTEHPSEHPSEHPTDHPTEHPTDHPTEHPTDHPTEKPPTTEAPSFVAFIDIETNWPTDQDVLLAISSATQINLSAMGIVRANNQLSMEYTEVQDAAYYPLRVGFTSKDFETVARKAIEKGDIAHVRLPVPTPTGPNEDGGLTTKQKILLGCLLGIGLPLLILLIVFLVWYFSRNKDQSIGDEYTKLVVQDTAMLDLNCPVVGKYGSDSHAHTGRSRAKREDEDPLL